MQNLSQTVRLQIYMRFDRPRSFKVIDFCSNRKPIHDFLLVIIVTWALSLTVFKIQYREFEKRQRPFTLPLDGIAFEFRRQTHRAKIWQLKYFDNRLQSFCHTYAKIYIFIYDSRRHDYRRNFRWVRGYAYPHFLESGYRTPHPTSCHSCRTTRLLQLSLHSLAARFVEKSGRGKEREMEKTGKRERQIWCPTF